MFHQNPAYRTCRDWIKKTGKSKIVSIILYKIACRFLSSRMLEFLCIPDVWRNKKTFNQRCICGKGVGLGLFPSDSLQSQLNEFIKIGHKGPYDSVERLYKISFESYGQFLRKSKKIENDCFLAIFGLILAMFLTSQPYDFDTIAHIGL